MRFWHFRLDTINSEIRLIQEEKTHAERVAEQLENRARGVDLGASNNSAGLLFGLDDSPNVGSLSARSNSRSSPQHDYLVAKYNTVSKSFCSLSFITMHLVCYDRFCLFIPLISHYFNMLAYFHQGITYFVSLFCSAVLD